MFFCKQTRKSLFVILKMSHHLPGWFFLKNHSVLVGTLFKLQIKYESFLFLSSSIQEHCRYEYLDFHEENATFYWLLHERFKINATLCWKDEWRHWVNEFVSKLSALMRHIFTNIFYTGNLYIQYTACSHCLFGFVVVTFVFII